VDFVHPAQETVEGRMRLIYSPHFRRPFHLQLERFKKIAANSGRGFLAFGEAKAQVCKTL